MPTNPDVPNLLALTPVKPERAEEFEAFVRDVVVPAVLQARPQAAGLWQLWRPSTTAESSQVADSQVAGSPGVAAGPPDSYAFVFFGGLPVDDWDLGPVFTEVHGKERGSELNRQFEDFVDGVQVIYQFSGPV